MPVGVEPTSTGLQPVAWPSGSSIIRKACPRQESNLALDLRRVACAPSHPEDVCECSKRYPARESNPVSRLRRPPCRPPHSRGVPSPGVEPGLRPSEGRVRIRHTPRATNHQASRRPDSNRHEPVYKTGASPFGHVGGTHDQQGCKDLNPVREFWRLAALPGAHPCKVRPRPNRDR